jgi:hypothetical protein
VQGASEGDVTVKMALMKFVKEDRRDAAQLGILQELTKENSLGDESNSGLLRRDLLEPDLVSNLVAEAGVPFERDPLGEQARRQSPWLQDHDFALSEKLAVEQDLWNLSRFSRAGRRLENEASAFFQLPNDLVFELVNREIARVRHGRLTGAALREGQLICDGLTPMRRSRFMHPS